MSEVNGNGNHKRKPGNPNLNGIPNANHPRQPRMIRAAMRRGEAMLLRVQGLSISQIAQKLGVSGPAAWKLVDKAIRERNDKYREEHPEAVRLALERLDGLLATWYPLALERDPKATELVLRIESRRSKLTGMDAVPHDSNQAGNTTNVVLVESLVVASQPTGTPVPVEQELSPLPTSTPIDVTPPLDVKPELDKG
jgi:predicted transcriptional regulator